MKTQYKYICFEKIDAGKRKTYIFECLNREGFLLGNVEWERGWRQYCFYPREDTVLARSCIDDISHFIKQLMDQRKLPDSKAEDK